MASMPSRVTWSHTRAETYRNCPRRYFYAYVSAPRGRAPDSAAPDRAAFVLSRLTSLDLALGATVHVRARELAVSALRRTPPGSFDELLGRSRQELNALWVNGRDTQAFIDDPTGRVGFEENFYERSPGPDRLGRLREKLGRCIASLREHPVWDLIRSAPRGAVRVIDRPVRWDSGGAMLWAAPDLVVALPGERPLILDWKTGREHPGAVLRQLRTYAWCASSALKVARSDEGSVGCAVFLDRSEERRIELGPEDLESVRRGAAADLQAFTDLAEAPPSAFPLATVRASCPFCPYWVLCEPEIRRAPSAAGEPTGKRDDSEGSGPATGA